MNAKSPTRRRPSAAWTAVTFATVSFAAVAALTVFSPKSQASPAEPVRGSAEPATTALAVAEELDAIVQPRFFQLGDETFGMSRVVRVEKNHPLRRFRPESDGEKARFERIAESGRECHLFFYQTVPALVAKPAFSRGSEPFRYLVSNGVFRWEQMKEFKPLVEEELTKLKAGERRNRDTKDYVIAMRPVRSAEACVSCHSAQGPKDILGVMVYVVGKERRDANRPAPVQTQQRVSRAEQGWERELDEVRAAK
jgi:hypothetical protein